MAQHEAATKDDTDTKDESSTDDETTHASTSSSDDHESPVEVTEEAKEKAHKMAEAFEERPTAVLPASNNTVTGTAVNDWLDEDGNSKFSDGKDGEASKKTDEKDD